MTLNVYTCCDHDGHWPVGGASVVVAESEPMARDLLIAALRDHGIRQSGAFTLRLINTDQPRAFVLNDGEY
jgi:hypothetical protein